MYLIASSVATITSVPTMSNTLISSAEINTTFCKFLEANTRLSSNSLTTNNTFINRVIVANGTTNFNFTAGTFTKSTFTTPDTVVLGGYRAASGALTTNYQGKVFYIRITAFTITLCCICSEVFLKFYLLYHNFRVFK